MKNIVYVTDVSEQMNAKADPATEWFLSYKYDWDAAQRIGFPFDQYPGRDIGHGIIYTFPSEQERDTWRSKIVQERTFPAKEQRALARKWAFQNFVAYLMLVGVPLFILLVLLNICALLGWIR